MLIKDCTYKAKKRCVVFGTMCSYPVTAPLIACGQAPAPAPAPEVKKAKKRKR